MLLPVIAAGLIFGGFVLADKLRRAKLGNQMSLNDDDIDWVPITIDGKDYLVGSRYYPKPLSTGAGAALAKSKGWIVPTPRQVDAIWQAADLKIEPVTAGSMGEVNKGANAGQYARHAKAVEAAIGGRQFILLGGESKDIVYLETNPFNGTSLKRFGIYGWHNLEGKPIQSPMWGHSTTYEDYSQRLRPFKEA